MTERKKKNVTISDVARLAGVSMKTVSRVFNNEKYVSEDKREKVLKVAGELNYRPSLQARGLAGSRSFMIGYFVDKSMGDYVSRVVRGILRRTGEYGCHLVFDVLEGANPETKLRQILNGVRLDGIVLSSPVCDDIAVLNLLHDHGIPTVRIGPGIDAEDTVTVKIDDVSAAYDVTKYLIGQGHRRIGFVKGDPNHGCSIDREVGYIRAMREHGLPIRNEWMASGIFSFESGVEAAARLLDQPNRPTAIFASNDEMAAGIIAAARQRGIRAPEEISVVGFDDDFLSGVISPTLTTIRQPIEDMAAAAVDAILEAKGGSSAPEGQSLVHQYELILRDSVSCLTD